MITLIKNIQLIDGTGKSVFKTDVLVKRKIISAIGNFSRYKAPQIIDGRGAYLAPGFIDLHSSLDHYLGIFDTEHQKQYLRSGVTTVIGGQDGVSLAPLLYGSTHLLKDWTHTGEFNVNWHTVREFFKNLSRKNLVLNFGTFVGYKTLREDIVGNDTSRNLTSNEVKVLGSILEKSLKEGAFGLSFGSENYGNELKHQDFRYLLQILSKFKGICAMPLSDANGAKISSLNKLIFIAEQTGVRIFINHFYPEKKDDENFGKCLELILQNAGRADIHFDIYSGNSRVLSLIDILPVWFKEEIREEDKIADYQKILEKLENDSRLKSKILNELANYKADKITIISASGHDYLNGQSLKAFSHNRGLRSSQGILELIKLTEGRAYLSIKDSHSKINQLSLSHSCSIVVGADSHFKDFPENGFSHFLKLIQSKKYVPLQTAIHKMTGLPAKQLGLKNRGLVKIGYAADLVIFREGDIRDVLVNGKHVFKNGQLENLKAGEVLRNSYPKWPKRF